MSIKFEKLYQTKLFVDYDAIIIISSYNRFEKLDRILHQLYTQKSKFTIKVIIYNDGSTDLRYENIPIKYSCSYISGQVNNGKYKYWKSINTLLKKASIFCCHAIIQIDDDFILGDNFIDRIMTEFFTSKKINNKYVAINYHNNSIKKEGKKIWFGYNYGVDGGSIFDFNFLKDLQFKIDPIPLSRWKINPLLSSGVWYQLTKKINERNLFVYQLNYSLAFHNGNEDSKMNAFERSQNPLVTPDFKQNIECRINNKYLENKNITKDNRMPPKCIICIPFSSEEPERKKAFKAVYDHYSKLGYNIFIGESDPFTRSASRNGAVPDIDFDVLFFADADIIVPLDQIKEAIYLSYETNEMVLAYEDLLLLDKDQTDFFYRNNTFDSFEKKVVKNQISGSFAITKKLWTQVGGYDERFKEWGGEDRAFYYSCAAIKNKFENKRIKGSAHHLFHKRKETEEFQFLSENNLLKRYKNSLGLSDKFYTYKNTLEDNKPLLSILKEENGPLNFETEGYLSCPIEILSSLPYSKATINQPLIGITISCFKSKEFVKQALLSVINQTCKNSIIFVISDGDISSFDYIKDLNNERVLFLRSKRNLGRYAIDHLLCTHILPMFGCKYWAPIDSDDYVDSNYLELLLTEIQKGYNVVFADQMRHRLNGIKDIVKTKPRTTETKLFRSACMLALWDLKFVLENNLTNPKYRVGWDTLMTLAVQIIGKYSIIKKPIYHIVKRQNSLTTAKETGQGSIYRKVVRTKLQETWQQILINPENTYEILRKSRI